MKVTVNDITVSTDSPHFDYFYNAHRTIDGAVKYAASHCERQFLVRCNRCNRCSTHIDIDKVKVMTNGEYDCGNCFDYDEKGKALDNYIDCKNKVREDLPDYLKNLREV